MTTCSNQCSVVFALDVYHESYFFAQTVNDSHNGDLSSIHGLLASANCDVCDGPQVIRCLVNVDLCIGFVLDLIDRCTAFAKDASNRAGGDCELQIMVGLFLEFNCLKP